ncbi:MAG: metallophosphoesterase family protein [Thermoflexales bacterium]|nr:metallophosphoesterase family protein [Thermoflexales bacterium]MCS7324479.1 metallophosphoesterase family protein [Thermoflexales bacterium]MCX7939446.1 metallophosphoesterase family protein [Thermoflexales bacterium]MDW8054263.1 metallophosphoesterase family protein [Anaerolineae bacterium]MDW8292217.1 metallophosphoesterase family protein [Anaerolineae bacterium]
MTKILAVSDEVVPWLHSPQLITQCADVDLIVSCGDLPPDYLEYLVSTLNKPALYVHGNHDERLGHVEAELPGWVNVDLRRVRVGTLHIAGLGGCLRYKPHASHQYTQAEQWLRAFWLAHSLARGLVQRGHGVDIMLSHAPLRGVHDGTDRAHIGFDAFVWLARTFKPRLWLHGHQHRAYDARQPAETYIGTTRVVNVHPYRILTLD